MKYSLEELCTKKEDQVFDRKSARKDAKGLSNHIVAFANADGGTLVIGIEDNGDITGIDTYTNNINDILRVPFDYCAPSVKVMFGTVECKDKNELLVYNAIAANPTATRSDLIEILDISARTIDRAIKSLKDKSAIERIGSKKTGYWSIITK